MAFIQEPLKRLLRTRKGLWWRAVNGSSRPTAQALASSAGYNKPGSIVVTGCNNGFSRPTAQALAASAGYYEHYLSFSRKTAGPILLDQ